MSRQVVVATHGHCLDGLASAALFTRLLRHVDPRELSFRYFAMGYGPGENGVPEHVLNGDENVILDYRFSASEKLTWYFDHHVSAFATEAERAAFAERVRAGSVPRFFHDGAYGSCTKLISDVGAKHFDLDPAPVKALVDWADMIDRAAFPSAKMAVEKKEPVLKLMTVVEHLGDASFLERSVPVLLEHGIEALAELPLVRGAYAPFEAEQHKFVALVEERAKIVGDTVLVDLTETELDTAPKFVTYALFPKSLYSVVVTRSKKKCKLSIGYNPWCGVPRTHDIARICEPHGGGGHPVVGAISLPSDETSTAKARGLASDIALELATPKT
jgi:hypothetical protein